HNNYFSSENSGQWAVGSFGLFTAHCPLPTAHFPCFSTAPIPDEARWRLPCHWRRPFRASFPSSISEPRPHLSLLVPRSLREIPSPRTCESSTRRALRYPSLASQ